jgi:DNA-binding NtrC family response regulator
MSDSDPLARHLVGTSEAMVRFRARLLKLAKTRVSVLLTGETGTGKTTAAHLLHQWSERARSPLVKVNCAGIPDSLLESELFGHERGAFTGALGRRDGLLVQAHTGTLFLDEVGDLSPSGQAKLLTSLDEGEVRPVGAVRPVRVDLRLVSATSRDLGSDGGGGQFRLDLFHRIAVLHLHLPPLRERPEDILRLARREVDRLARRHGRPLPELAPCARRFLESHPWPGNVRELSHRLEAAILLFDGERLEGEHLREATPLELVGATHGVREPSRASRAVGTPFSGGIASGGVRAPRYSHFGDPATERARILEALTACRGNRTATAHSLGMSRNTLRLRMARLGIRG